MKPKKRRLIKFFLSFQRPFILMGLGAGVLLLLTVLLKLPSPLITRYLIDYIIPEKSFPMLNLLCIILLFIIFLNNAAAYLMRILFAKYKAKVRFNIEKSLYKHIQALPLGFFLNRPSGYILSRISEVANAESLMADTFLYAVRDFITLLVGAVLILNLHFELGLFSLVLLPFFIYAIRRFHNKIKDVNILQNEARAQYQGKLEKNISAIEKIKASVKETKEQQRTAHKLWHSLELKIKVEKVSALANVVSGFIGMIAPFVVLWYGVSEIIRGNMTLGTFVAINSFLSFLYTPAQNLSNIAYGISRAMAGLERVYEIFQIKPEPGGKEIENITHIDFQDVHFAFNTDIGSSQWVLNGLNLKINPGEKVAVVGKSGSGKTTLIKMILKFHDPIKGKILISGMDAAGIDPRSLRKRIAYIGQNFKILEDELNEVVNSGEADRLLEKLNLDKCLLRAHLYQNQVSGGEAQRFEILEALKKEADVLIVDEGTSNLDAKTEDIAVEEIFREYKGKTIIFVTHRMTHLKDFDRVIYMKNGKIVDEAGEGEGEEETVEIMDMHVPVKAGAEKDIRQQLALLSNNKNK